MEKQPQKRIDLRAALADQVKGDAPVDLSFAELVRTYTAAHYDGAEMTLKKWVEAFGDQSAWSIDPTDLDLAAEAMIDAGYAASTVNRNLSQVGSLYKWAKQKRLPPRGFTSPTIGLRRYEESVRQVELTERELRRIIDATLMIKDRRFSVLVRLLADSGARRSEVLERRWNDIDLAKRQILVRQTKTKVPRVLFFSQETADFMIRVWPVRHPAALLFESSRSPGNAVNYRKSWQRVVSAIGRPDLHLHDLRHHRAKKLLSSGITIGVASQVLGHSSLILQRRYGHLETMTTQHAIEKSWNGHD